jgi:hypothetical protein
MAREQSSLESRMKGYKVAKKIIGAAVRFLSERHGEWL